MAAMLKSAAVGTNKGPPSSFYATDKSKPNPVLQTLEQEINVYVAYMRKRTAPGYKPSKDEASSRGADILFELWNKYQPRLPQIYYEKKLLEMGDFLVSVKEYNLALFQCYGRYLKHFGDINVEAITDVNTFKSVFFPDGFDSENAGFTFRALMGLSSCRYQTVKMGDPKLQNTESVDKCIRLLSFLRLVTQVILPKESLSWLVYNGTIHIYSVSRHLMCLGHSARVLEYLLWACMCMEGSVPLLQVKYLTWRSTLYTAVCQAYYDCKATQQAEGFARRALAKIKELSELEGMSSAEDISQTEHIFRQATIKMAVMVYKRTVFETRKKPKGLLRPKTRANLKDAQYMPWPRTPSEKLLVDMFEGSAAQFLCILETLSDSNRRTLLTSPPAADSEIEILDVYAELFLAAQEIISGGGGAPVVPHPQEKPGKMVNTPTAPSTNGVVVDKSLIEMATAGEDGVPLSAVVKVVKLAFCFEQWDTFDTLIALTVNFIKDLEDSEYNTDEKALEILLAMDRAGSARRQKKHTVVVEDPVDPAVLPPPPTQGSGRSGTGLNDDLILLGETLVSVTTGSFSPDEMDMDIMVDAALFLWNKCKAVFQKYQTGSAESAKYLNKMENPSKWVYILDMVHQVLGWCGVSSVDPALTAEVSLRLGMVLESSAMLDAKEEAKVKDAKKSSRSNLDDSEKLFSESKTTLSDATQSRPGSRSVASRSSVASISMLNQSVRDQLMQSRDILELGLQNISFAREVVATTDGKSIADISWVKEFNKELFEPVIPSTTTDIPTENDEPDQIPNIMSNNDSAVWNTVKDLHLELIYMYHRICLKLAKMGPAPGLTKKPSAPKQTKPFKRRTCSNLDFASKQSLAETYVETFDDLSEATNKNQLSKALLYTQKALMSGSHGGPTREQIQLIEDAMAFITKASTEERRLYLDNKIKADLTPVEGKVPPAPQLLSRTERTMVFRPTPFQPSTGEKVAWYRLFARSAAGSNVKVRLNDYHLQGTGEEIPSFRSEIRVSGLTPHERYIFAVAAYTEEGALIGGSIGESSKPILASHPLPILMAWAYVAQTAYQVGVYNKAREACRVLWDHFVAEPPPPQGVTYTTDNNNDFKLILHRLNKKVVSMASPVLLRMFLTSVFIHVDVNVKEQALYCDSLCDKGPLYKGQIERLHQCEKLLVAVELCGWLNEGNLALQAVVQCYGLVSPIIHYKIPSVPVIQVLERCQAILQEIPTGLRQKRVGSISDSLHHMTACLTYHMAKVIRTWGQRNLANNLNDVGRKLLAVDDKEKNAEGDSGKDPLATIDQTETGSLTLTALKKKGAKKGLPVEKEKEPDGPVNEELKALEAHMLKLSKQAQSEHALTGNEDPSILHAYIAYLPSRLAYKEILKFKRRTRYLEFFVQVIEKALAEGLADYAIDWCQDTFSWLNKRNEQIIGSKAVVNKQPGVMAIAGDDPKKYAAAMMEYNKEKKDSPRTKYAAAQRAGTKKKKPQKYKLLHSNSNMTEQQKEQQEQLELKAIEVLARLLPELYRGIQRKCKLRKVCVEELPWRCQLNILLGLSHFGVFLQKLEVREKVIGNSANSTYRTTFLDQEWFTFENAGTLVVGWEGGPPRLATRDGYPSDHRGKGSQDRPKTGIEIAAAAATGHPPPPMFAIPEEEEDTPRTYRSDRGDSKVPNEVPKELVTTRETIEALTKTFDFFRRAVVLSHRGQHWTLLQNACRSLWNVVHTALLRAFSDTSNANLITVEELRELVWLPCYTAADCLLDCLYELQIDITKQAAKNKNGERPVVADTWSGDITTEKGGASLKFEDPLDDISLVDTRWVRRITLRVIEMLYYEKKWEHLVDLAFRFNALTSDRYVEQVNPLVIKAQRELLVRVSQEGGHVPPQPHFVSAERELGEKISAKEYLGLQLTVDVSAENLPAIDAGAHIDPDGHDIYSGGVHALRNIMVPLDVNYTLQALRTALDTSQYNSRALQHSRKLLMLYLSGRQNTSDGISRGPSRVEFRANTAHPQPIMPPDLRKQEFHSVDDIQTSPMPASQVGVVISSYNKSIEMLTAKNQKGLSSQALHELGNLQYHIGNVKAAYKSWSVALDVILGITDAIHTWRGHFNTDEDIASQLLNKCGLWGCVLGGVLASNISQYVITSNLGLRMDCCFLSGFFFKALFRSSLPHPRADRDYALYDIGEGCEVTNLVPGVDLLSDRFRVDGRTLVSALRWVTEELARGKHNLFVLPLLTLYNYFTTFVCRDIQRAVDGRILRVRTLTDLCLFSEAFITLQRLLYGERLPHTADSNFRQVESKMPSTKFNTSKPIMDVANLKVLENVIEKRLSSNLSTLYGPHLTCHLSLVHAHLLVALSNTMPVLPHFEHLMGPEGPRVPHTLPSMSKGGGKGPKMSGSSSMTGQSSRTDNYGDVSQTPSVASSQGFSPPNRDDDTDTGMSASQATMPFTSGKKTVDQEFIKGTLLGVADQMLTALSEILLETAEYDGGVVEDLTAAELELVVLCKQELSSIATQRHHSAMASRSVLAALKLLQSSRLFTKQSASQVKMTLGGEPLFKSESSVRITQSENIQFAYQNFQSRSRLDARLWLDCRLALVKSMLGEVKGMGDIKGHDKGVGEELAECRTYIAEGIAESEGCGDVEMQCEFLMQGVHLEIMEGIRVELIIESLQEILELVEKATSPAQSTQLLHALALVHLTDLIGASGLHDPDKETTEVTLPSYVKAQMLLLSQMEDLGEKITHRYPVGANLHFSTPESPLLNVYIPQLLHLVEVKLRIGHAMARNATRSIKRSWLTMSRHGTQMSNMADDPNNQGMPDERSARTAAEFWMVPLGVLMSGYELSRASATRIASLEAEILLNIGKLQRQLSQIGRFNSRMAVNTLIEAIKTTYINDHDLGIIRQAYLEIALIYLASSGVVNMKEGTFVESMSDSDHEESERQRRKGRKKKWVSKKDMENIKKQKKLVQESDISMERNAAYVALRCAAAVCNAQRERVLLLGDANVMSQTPKEKSQADMPEFAILDLVSSYVFGIKKKIYKNDIEEEMAPLIESLEPKHVETYDEQVHKAKLLACDISWIHLLGYQAILQRLGSTGALSTKPETKPDDENHSLGPEFDMGFFSHMQFDTSLNHNVVRSLAIGPMWSIRLAQMHKYLTSNLTTYAVNCTAIYPPSAIQLGMGVETPWTAEIKPVSSSYQANLVFASDPEHSKHLPDSSVPPGSHPEAYKPNDKAIVGQTEADLTTQWYQPSLEEHFMPATTVSGKKDKRVMLIYSMTRKTGTFHSAMQWVSLSQLTDLHDRLSVLRQRGEISLGDKKTKESVASTPAAPTNTKGKKQRIKALSPKIKKDDHLEWLLRQCLTDAQGLFGVVPEEEQPALIEIPFDVNKTNILNFEKLFDPCYGHAIKSGKMLDWLSKLFP
ncbi:unnamed protein product [Owenia fusiformis]|uniref:Uncharacterized protein n=1 Tax=Owenia fusiformis TaxID=6347 RepID=A0A8J1XG58_OWEFU|nr:unnamed protein product [Owenia fusiformis]